MAYWCLFRFTGTKTMHPNLWWDTSSRETQGHVKTNTDANPSRDKNLPENYGTNQPKNQITANQYKRGQSAP